MKQKLSLLVLLGLFVGAMLSGCNKEDSSSSSGTNAPAASTNK